MDSKEGLTRHIVAGDIPTIYCALGQSIWEAARMHRYAPPQYRVGASRDAPPRDGEVLVARVKASKHSLSLPIFRMEVKKDELA